MLDRPRLLQALRTSLRRSPITAILGPRQCGKTTLSLGFAREQEPVTYFDLEDPAVLMSLEQPKSVLGPLPGLVIIDEIQRRTDLFPILRLLADRDPLPARFLLLGSASPDLVRRSSESLAGRVEFVEMGGFDMEETGADALPALWWRGGFPRSFLAGSDADSAAWRENFIRTFLERDLAQFGLNIPALALRRFWTMVAHYHGQTWNSSEIAASLGINETTARRHLDILAGAYMVRVLPPWFQNIAKRQRRAPKVYLRDTGILHSLIGIGSPQALSMHPKCGASWEGLAVETVLRSLPSRDAYYWAVHSGPELDLLILFQGMRLGFELKYADAPQITRSMRTAMADLSLDRLFVIYPGDRPYTLGDRIDVLPLKLAPEALAQL